MHSFETRPTSSKRAEGEGRGEEEERRRGEEGKGREGAGGGGMSGAGHDRAKSKISGSETNSPNTTARARWDKTFVVVLLCCKTTKVGQSGSSKKTPWMKGPVAVLR